MTHALTTSPVYIAGVAETPLGKVTDQNEFSMVALAAREALAEAGLGFRDVDALFTNYMGEEGSVQLGEYLGLRPRYAESSDMGGASFEFFVHHAMTAIATGRCEVALIGYASRQRSRRNRKKAASALDGSLAAQFETPFGIHFPIGHYALSAARYMHQYGVTLEHLAEVAVAARQWAALNPKAWVRDPLSIDDVMSSPMLCDPLRKLDCCLVTDGGGAIVVTTKSRARDAAKRPIRVLGVGESHVQWHVSQCPDLTVTPGIFSGRDAFAMAGIKPSDVDVFEPYDNFTHAVLLYLEDLGFCGKGEAGAFVSEGNLRPGGSLPSMTSGGGLSYCHPGALGILLLVEAVRQLRGEAGDRQVPDAEIAVAHGTGGLAFSTASTVVLARD
ncbi:acetyl-CoA acetyltransferase [Mesorhizobium soli]|uniref:acetyl-CoA acetyltransferase n=1 Tax=Pseudaminobacter soli (ex Li et al. 2025) TaxID=1295366 RepID=UPI002475F152|nr:acetyl-CoA acetyltransferase [Mesorhizobium soli]MDH6235020.1 acetyl-CoA acetyltransferase [Mesorhizobium soli]